MSGEPVASSSSPAADPRAAHLQQDTQQQPSSQPSSTPANSPNAAPGPGAVHGGPVGDHADSIAGTVNAFVFPSTYLRPRTKSRSLAPKTTLDPQNPVDREQLEGLRGIRAFLKVRTSYDVLPLSYRLILLDSSLLVKKSLNILIQNGIVSAPLWDSRTSTFAGLLTVSDYINVIQYYWQNQHLADQVDQFRLNSLREIERAINVTPIETVSIHPERPLYEACRKMLKSRARRIPLVDIDDETQRAMVVSVITQYRILKFIAVNNKRELEMLGKPLSECNIGTYDNLATAKMTDPVIDVIHKLSEKSISSVPILDDDGLVINVFESVDVITVIKGGNYDDLNLSVGDALLRRPDDFPGIYTCGLHDSLAGIMDTVRKSRVHRFVVIDEKRVLKGLLTLSDILEYILLEGEGEGESMEKYPHASDF